MYIYLDLFKRLWENLIFIYTYTHDLFIDVWRKQIRFIISAHNLICIRRLQQNIHMMCHVCLKKIHKCQDRRVYLDLFRRLRQKETKKEVCRCLNKNYMNYITCVYILICLSAGGRTVQRKYIKIIICVSILIPDNRLT